MSKALSTEWELKIEREAEAYVKDLPLNNDYERGVFQGMKCGYDHAGIKYASLLIEAQERIKDMENSMRNIIRAIGAADYLGAKRIANEALSPVNPKNNSHDNRS